MNFTPSTGLRLFTPEEAIKYLPEVQAYTEAEFGSADSFQVAYLIHHREEGVQFYQPYGDFSTVPPKVLGLASCMFISYAMYEAMLRGDRKETDLDPWKPTDDRAIFWICAVVSDMPGALAKCISGVLETAEKHPYIDRVDRVGVVVTGPQGYLLAHTFGLVEHNQKYKDDWLFMDREIDAGSFRELGRKLQDVWSMTKVRDAIHDGRAIWGNHWREGKLENVGIAMAQNRILKLGL